MQTEETGGASGRVPDQETTILLIDDEPDVLDAYAALLELEYAVRTATSGPEALDQIDEAVDIVFLDRRMPEMTGDEVLDELRSRGFEMPVSMLTAVDPGANIVDMPFDDYLTKPVDKDTIFEKVTVLLNRAECNDTGRELYRLASKKATLEAEGIDPNNERYQELLQQMETLRAQLDQTLDELFEQDPESPFHAL